MARPYLYAAAKRALDLVCATTAIVALWPLFLMLAIYIKRRSPGSVLYRGTRVGLHGKPFEILKFRSMVEGAECLGGSATADDDVRLTAAGKVLRKYKLDELPQLFNVIRGEMSLVGPRPEVAKYTDMYSENERRILELRPGITDWATIWDANEGSVLAGSGDPEKLYEEIIRPTKTKLQLLYLETRSFWTDLRIIAHTAVKLIDPNWTPKEIAAYEDPQKMQLRSVMIGRTSQP